MNNRQVPLTLALLLAMLAGPEADAKSLYWRSLVSDATLEADGTLRVTETQVFVFDGDWNGGERRFDVRHAQSLELIGIERIDGDAAVPLSRGDLSQVDQFRLAGNVLRWRSRLPSDPPFENRELTYRIRYALRGVLRGRDGRFALAHDFVFPDREGRIETFSLRLTSDAVWGGIESPLTAAAEDLQPGRGFVVTRSLTFRGAGVPAAATVLPSPAFGWAMAVLLCAGIAGLGVRFFLAERARGRFAAVTPAAEIDDAWLEAHVFQLSPEAVGTAYDNRVGAAEVAAALASLAQQKKIESSVEQRARMQGGPLLRLKLLVDRDEIGGHYRTLVNKLFFNSRITTDTDAIRKHYRDSGLDLASILRKPIEDELARLPKWSSKKRVVDWRVTIGVLAATFVAMIATAFRGGNDGALISSVAFYGVLGMIGSIIAARFNSRALTVLPLRFAFVFAFLVPLVYATFSYLLRASEFLFGRLVLVTCAAWTLAVINLIFDGLRTDESVERIAFRKRIVAARQYLLAQLASREPRLRDDWFPYLLALGLGTNVDSWFRAFGDSSPGTLRDTHTTSSSFGGSSSGSGVSSWTGGGGAFGGAGATGAWAVAASTMGAGVSAPSSSSEGGGSSGGGGSSSGGGGGGGW